MSESAQTASEDLREMRRALGRQLAAQRRDAGLTQHELGAAIGYSRGVVSLAEIGRLPKAPEFWAACDRRLHTGGQFTAGLAQIEQVRDAQQLAAARTAQATREARALAAFAAAQERGEIPAQATAARPCPHCGQELIIVTTLIPGTARSQSAPS